MDFTTNDELNINYVQTSERLKMPIEVPDNAIVINGPDDSDSDTLHQVEENEFLNQILADIDEAREVSPILPIDPVVIEEQKSVEIENKQRTVEPLPYTPPATKQDYEVLMPMDYWKDNIVTELEKYGLPPETQPTDFFNYLLINRQKLSNQEAAKELEKVIRVETVKNTNTQYLTIAAIVLLAVLAFKFWGKGLKSIVGTPSWIV